MKFLNKIIDTLLAEATDLSSLSIVLPGKRPVIFIKKILAEKEYSGILPDFYTISELVLQMSGLQEISGAPLWLYAYRVYSSLFSDEEFGDFIKWFPTLHKDWDDMMKFYGNDEAVLARMLDEERIKNWGENLGDENSPRRRNLDFWKRMSLFLPELKKRLLLDSLATAGMQNVAAKENIPEFLENSDKKFIFCGFNALTPFEEKLIRGVLQRDRGKCFFQGDRYYLDDERQEAGAFLREYRGWSEFNTHRPFRWAEDDFRREKSIKTFEVSGSVPQTKILPDIFKEIPADEHSQTAVVLLDENLLPACLDALNAQPAVNITMGFPVKNLAFSIGIKKLFYIQKRLAKGKGNYYYSDVLSVLEIMPKSIEDQQIISKFQAEIKEKNIVYLSPSKMSGMLSGLSYYQLFLPPESVANYLEELLNFCTVAKESAADDVIYENISHFEKAFRTIGNQLKVFDISLDISTLEVVVNQIINTETIDFEGEPLDGLQIMGLLETRLLNFKNIILLSVNEGKLPLGNTQNTYLPFDVRKHFKLHTFLENDSIYAYHFYRLLQDSERVFLLYNGLSSGLNTGEKSRFITQLELESPHKIEHIVIDNPTEPSADEVISIHKTPAVLAQLDLWKERISSSHISQYLYDPVQFYLEQILGAKEPEEIEEEVSQKNYGNLVHYSLEFLYKVMMNKVLSAADFEAALAAVPEALDHAMKRLKHQQEYYETGINYIHMQIAREVVLSILLYDKSLVENGHSLEILDVEKAFSNLPYVLPGGTDVKFKGFIDRIDRLDGQLRIIDYKTAPASELTINVKDNSLQKYKHRQAIQLSIYLYFAEQSPEFAGKDVQAGIWSFAQIKRGMQPLCLSVSNSEAMRLIAAVIEEILNPEVVFGETVKEEMETE